MDRLRPRCFGCAQAARCAGGLGIKGRIASCRPVVSLDCGAGGGGGPADAEQALLMAGVRPPAPARTCTQVGPAEQALLMAGVRPCVASGAQARSGGCRWKRLRIRRDCGRPAKNAYESSRLARLDAKRAQVSNGRGICTAPCAAQDRAHTRGATSRHGSGRECRRARQARAEHRDGTLPTGLLSRIWVPHAHQSPCWLLWRYTTLRRL